MSWQVKAPSRHKPCRDPPPPPPTPPTTTFGSTSLGLIVEEDGKTPQLDEMERGRGVQVEVSSGREPSAGQFWFQLFVSFYKLFWQRADPVPVSSLYLKNLFGPLNLVVIVGRRSRSGVTAIKPIQWDVL